MMLPGIAIKAGIIMVGTGGCCGLVVGEGDVHGIKLWDWFWQDSGFLVGWMGSRNWFFGLRFFWLVLVVDLCPLFFTLSPLRPIYRGGRVEGKRLKRVTRG